MICVPFSPETFYPWGSPDDPKPELGAVVLCHLEPWDSSGSGYKGALGPQQLKMRFVEHNAWDELDGPSDVTTLNNVVGWRPLGVDREKYAALYSELKD